MSGSLYGMEGMGSSGLGIGGLGGLPPGLLAMLLRGGGMGGAMPGLAAAPQAPGPMVGAQGAGGMSPMSALMSAGALQGQRPMMPNPMGMPAQAPPGGPQMAPNPMSALMGAGGLGGAGGLQGLLAALKGNQQGLSPQPGVGGAQGTGANPLINLPAILRSLFGGGGGFGPQFNAGPGP
jgi:hypothetical protein